MVVAQAWLIATVCLEVPPGFSWKLWEALRPLRDSVPQFPHIQSLQNPRSRLFPQRQPDNQTQLAQAWNFVSWVPGTRVSTFLSLCPPSVDQVVGAICGLGAVEGTQWVTEAYGPLSTCWERLTYRGF